ncbi:MAG: glycosyltransferase, partial [Anaerolineae bacterium]|nr:glycosyltransferase [Anaerolineae bacterium]
MSAVKVRYTTTRSPKLLRTRFLDMIPGGLAWLGMVLTVLGAIIAPLWVIWSVALLACYVAGRFVLASIAALWGLRLVRQWAAMDWSMAYMQRATADSLPLDAVQHMVIIPNYEENSAVLRRTLTHLAQQKNAQTALTIVLAMEGVEAGARAKADQLRAEFAPAFAQVIVTIHPAHQPHELQCKSANLAWAVQQAKRILVDEGQIDLDHVVVTTMDADTIWHPHYFASLSVLFATDPQRYQTYWQAPIRYHGNVWAVNPLMRL